MHDDVDDFDLVESRLRSVGRQPVDRALEQRVLARAHRSRLTWLHSTKLKVAAAVAGGFMIGSVGLASAGALPGPAQDVAHSALGVLGVHVPPGKDRYNGPECGDVANHGEYVDAHPDDPAAGKSPCGKPNRAVKHPQRTGTDPAGVPGDAGRKGPPPWAGQGKEKDKKQGDGDSPTTDLPSATPANPEQDTTTTTTTVAAEPSTATVAAEPTATTSVTGEGATSTTIESTTSTTTTTAS